MQVPVSRVTTEIAPARIGQPKIDRSFRLSDLAFLHPPQQSGGVTTSLSRLRHLRHRQDGGIGIDTLSGPQTEGWPQQTCGADLIVFIVT